MKFSLILLSILFSLTAHADETSLQTIDLENFDASTLSAGQLSQEVTVVEATALKVDAVPQPIEPVTASKLKLMGRGIAPRGDSAQSLALACYDEGCKTLRFVYFKNPNETYYIGGLIHNPKAVSPRFQKKALSLVVAEYMSKHQTSQTESKKNRHAGHSFLLIIGAASVIALTMPMTGPGTLLTSAVMFPTLGGIYFLSTGSKLVEFMTSGTLVEVQAGDQGRWNWSSQPKRVKRSNFDQILNQIVNGRETDDFRLTQEGRFERKQRRLMRKGVEF